MRKIITSIACFLLLFGYSTNAQTTTFTANSGTFSCATNEFCVTIDVTDFDSIINMQFAMQWDTAIMQINSWTSNLPPQEFFNPSETTEGRLGFLWGGSSGSLDLNDGTSIIELCFAPNGGGTSAIEFIPPLITGGIIEVSGFRNGQLLQNVPADFNNGTIMVSDITAPEITCPNDTILTSGGTVVGNLAPTITDDCSTFNTSYILEIGGTQVGSGTGDVSGTFFNPGTTTVTYTATDASNNMNSCSFDVTVNGTTPPTNDILEYIPTISFDCNNNTAQMCLIVNNFDSITSHQMGIFYDTSALEYVSFNRDLVGTGTFNPNIFPNAAFYTWAHPVAGPNDPVSTTLPNGSKILTIDFNIVGDLVSPLITLDDFSPITPVQVSMEGEAMPLVRDVDYLLLPDVVTIIDQEGPTLTGACENITADADLGDCGARLVIPTPVAVDECSGVDSLTYTINGVTTLIDPGATEFSQNFDLGTTDVTITAYDGNGNTTDCDFTVTVEDGELPSVACPENVVVDAAAGQTSAIVNDIAPLGFTENCPGADISYTTDNGDSGMDDASGLSFPIGITTVSYLIKDNAGNESNCSFTVTVNQVNVPQDLEFQPTITVDCATDTVTYCLLTNNFSNITQIQLGIRYDVSALQFISATKDVPGAGGAPNPNLSPDHIWYAWSRPSPVSLANGTKLLTIKFALIGEVSFPLTLIEDIGPGLQILIEDVNGTVDLNDVDFLPEMGTQTIDTQGPTLLSGCLEINVSNDEDVCGANLDIPAPTAQDFCSGVDSITYEINGVVTLFPDGATSFNADFPIGTTIVRFRAYDGSGNESNCGLDVIVTDDQAPDLVCPSTDVIPNDPGECSAFVDFNLQPTSFSDNCSVEDVRFNITGEVMTTGIGLVQPQTFPVGQSFITYTVSDAAGNSTTCQITIEVGDTETPGITCPMDIEVTIPPSDTSATIFLDVPTGIDNCSSDLTYTYTVGGITFPVTAPIGVEFSIGETTVTGTVNDSNDDADCTFTVTVIQAGPEDLIECPQDVFSCTNVVTGIDPIFLANESDVTVTYSLNHEGTITGGNGSANGQNFMIGTTEVTYSATGLGTTDECTFLVRVDSIAPTTISCPGPILVFATETSCETAVSWDIPVITDNCGIETMVPTHNPGDLFGPGITNVTYAAVDSVGNQAFCIFQVEVRDTFAPVVTNCPPADLTTTTVDELCGAIGNWTVPNAIDNCGPVTIDNSHSPGDTFFITTTVVYTFTDGEGNNSFCSFIIEVDNADTDPPVIMNCPTDTVIFASASLCGATYVWQEPTITDACSESFINSPTFMPGDTFAIGTTTVGYLGFDSQGNQATCNFDITVRDTTPPALFCPSTVLAFATEPDQCGTIVNTFNLPAAFDNCTDNVGVVCSQNPGDFFEVGTTTITCTAIDNSGNESTCLFNVIVEDQFVPTITCPDDIVLNLDGVLVSGTPGIVNSIVANNNCDSVLLTFNLPTGADNCPIGMPEQIEGPLNGTLVPIGMATNFGFILSDGVNVSDTCRFNITVNPLTDITISGGGNDEYCSGESFTLSVDSISGATYEWTLPLGNTVSGSSLVVTDITPGVNIGNYTVVCRLADNCEATATITIDNIQDAPAFEASASGEGCNANVQLLVVLDPTSPALDSVRWTGPNGFTSTETQPTLDNPVSGDYIITAYNNSCSTTQTVSLSTVNIPNVSVFSDCGDNGICVGDNCNLIGTATTDPTLVFNWVAEDGCTINIDVDDNIATITPVDPGSCVIMYWLSKDGCTSDTAMFIVNTIGAPTAVDDFVAINSGTTQIGIDILGNDLLTDNVNPSVRAVTQPNDGVVTFDEASQTFLFMVDESFVDLNQFQYEVCYECDEIDLCSQAIVTIELQDTSCMVPSLITPNDDGFNDELVINCLRGSDFPDAEISIYNQWGDEVYRRKPYGNGIWWDGTFNGEPVTDGTFYYIFTKETGGSVNRGYITVHR